MDEVRDESEVHDAGGMQSVLLKVLRLLAGVARSSGSGRAGPADPRILQAPPPLAAPEGRGVVVLRAVQGTGLLGDSGGGDLPRPAPRRLGASASDRPRHLITLQDFMPEERTSDPHPGARGAAAPDPIAWRASVLSGYMAQQSPVSLPHPPRVVLSAPRQPNRQTSGKQKQQRTQSSRPELVDAHCRQPSQPTRQPATLLPVEHPQHSDSPLSRAPPMLTAPIRLRNFFGPLAVDEDEALAPHWADHPRTQHRPTEHGRQSLPESRARRDRQRQAHSQQAPKQSARRRQRTEKVATEDSSGKGPTLDVADEPQPTARPLGNLSARPEFQGQLPSASASCTPPRRRMGGWSMPRPHKRSAASALHIMAEEGPVSSRICSEEFQGDTGPVRPTSGQGSILYWKAEYGRLDPPGDSGTRGGTAHRSVRWGRPSVQKSDSEADSALRASAESDKETGVRPPGQFRAGRPLAVQHTPSLATPEGGGGLMRAACEAWAVPVGASHGSPRHQRHRLLEWTCMQCGSAELSSHLPV